MDNNTFQPEEETPTLPANHQKIVLPKRSKSKMAPRRKARVKRFLIKLAIVFAIFITAITYGAYKINQFFNTNRLEFRSPLQMPVLIVPRGSENDQPQSSVLPEVRAAAPTEAENAGQPLLGNGTVSDVRPATNIAISEIVRKVYQLESSSTNSAGCAAKGLFNGYGYIPGSCYKSHAEVKALVTKWFEEKLPKHGLAKSLCGYNLGFSSDLLDDCIARSSAAPYYNDFLSIN